MGEPFNSPTDDRWVTTPANSGGTASWPDQQTTVVPFASGQEGNLWYPYRSAQALVPRRGPVGGIQTHTAFNNVLPKPATRLPRPFPATMPGAVARNQDIPNASSVHYSSPRTPVQFESYQRVFEEARHPSELIHPVSWRDPLSKGADTPGLNGGCSSKKQSDSPVIRALQKLVQDKDKELSLKNEIIRNYQGLLQLRDGSQYHEAGATAKRGKKRSRKADAGSESSDSDGTLNDTISGPVKRSCFNETARKQTAATRECGACIRCRRLKKRVHLLPPASRNIGTDYLV